MGAESALIWANLGSLQNCEATVLAKRGCWTFLKGGIFLTQPLNTSTLYFEVIKLLRFKGQKMRLRFIYLFIYFTYMHVS